MDNQTLLDVIETKSFVHFAEGNKYRFWQDYSNWEGIPSSIDFYPVKEVNGSIVFIGDGYGILPQHKLVGKYGSGAIYVFKSQIPHLIELCLNIIKTNKL